MCLFNVATAKLNAICLISLQCILCNETLLANAMAILYFGWLSAANGYIVFSPSSVLCRSCLYLFRILFYSENTGNDSRMWLALMSMTSLCHKSHSASDEALRRETPLTSSVYSAASLWPHRILTTVLSKTQRSWWLKKVTMQIISILLACKSTLNDCMTHLLTEAHLGYAAGVAISLSWG